MNVVLTRLRSICMRFPEASERLSHGTPSWFAGKGKMFATYSYESHGSDMVACWFAAPPGAQEALTARSPDRFFRPPYVGHRGWLAVDLRRAVDWEELERFLEEAYRQVAARRLVRLLDAEGGGAG